MTRLTFQQFPQPRSCSATVARNVDSDWKSGMSGWSRSTVLHLGWGRRLSLPTRVMLSPSLLQPRQLWEVKTNFSSRVEPGEAWQL